jgi:signal transduction histidine kinase
MMLIEDNGCGFDYAAVRQNIKGSMGLIAIEERVTSLGGTLDIESKPQEGTTVRISIDVDVQASQLALNKMEFSH